MSKGLGLSREGQNCGREGEHKVSMCMGLDLELEGTFGIFLPDIIPDLSCPFPGLCVITCGENGTGQSAIWPMPCVIWTI